MIGQNVRVEPRFDEDTLQKIMDFKTAERLTPFVRELQETDLMCQAGLPEPGDVNELTQRRRNFQEELQKIQI